MVYIIFIFISLGFLPQEDIVDVVLLRRAHKMLLVMDSIKKNGEKTQISRWSSTKDFSFFKLNNQDYFLFKPALIDFFAHLGAAQ